MPKVTLGTVYAVEAGGLVKIGYTSQPIDQRIGELQRMNGWKLELVETWPGTRDTERLLHRVFGDYREHGEWFSMPPDWVDRVEFEIEASCKRHDQTDLAEILAGEFECAGLYEVGVLEILDALACAELALVTSSGMQASAAYICEIRAIDAEAEIERE